MSDETHHFAVISLAAWRQAKAFVCEEIRTTPTDPGQDKPSIHIQGQSSIGTQTLPFSLGRYGLRSGDSLLKVPPSRRERIHQLKDKEYVNLKLTIEYLRSRSV